MADHFKFGRSREIDRNEPIWEVRAPGQDGATTVMVNVPDAAVEGLRNAALQANPDGGDLNCWILTTPLDTGDLIA